MCTERKATGLFVLADFLCDNATRENWLQRKLKIFLTKTFLTNFLTQFKDLHVQTSKGKTNRNCIQLSFTLEQICSIYIHVCAKWENK